MSLHDKMVELVTLSNIPQKTLSIINTVNQTLDEEGVAPGIALGEQAPDFSLLDTQGRPVSLADRLHQGPVVLSFYRGDWCNFCNAELHALQQEFCRIREGGGSLLAISPQTPEEGAVLVERHQLSFELLSDPEQAVISAYKLQFEVPEALQQLYLEVFELDVSQRNANGRWLLPIPATFVLNPSGVVVNRYVSANYATRMEPETIVQTLDNISRKNETLLTDLQSKNEILTHTVEELRRAQEQLIRQEKRITVGNLASGLVHEIKNMLGPVTLLQLVEHEVSPAGKEKLRQVYDARDRILDLIDEVRRLATHDATHYATQGYEATPLIEEALALAKMDEDVANCTISLNATGSGRVQVNRNKIIQVIINLVRNAAHALEGKASGEIQIGISIAGREAIISVSDNGKGIAAHRIEQIWQPFFSTKGDAGMGLGLDICKSIIEGHQGTIRCESREGEGTTFSFSLPLEPAAAAPTNQPTSGYL